MDQNYIVLESINMEESKIHESNNIVAAEKEDEKALSNQKKTTGRFNRFPTSSEKKQAKKVDSFEDDSIIRILPGLPSGLQGGATAIEVLEEVDVKETSNSAIGGQLSPVIKVKKS
jgi:hypothetical protein